MFGKPEWFREKKIGWGLDPISWQGWVYVFLWVNVLIVPFTVLLTRNQPLEAGVWIVTILAFMLREVYVMKRALAEKADSPEQTANDQGSPPVDCIETRNFDLERRR
jgi:hypothetical protein